ncbi:transporter [Streptomyces virginiae]|uniref:transporter n=1 Tax=Streptomyces virginiae TaxID=1961 RepID=UPI0036C819CA
MAEAEADLQGLVEGAMEAMLGVRFLASEYSTGSVHGGRIDSLGLDENGAPVIVEYKRSTDPGVLSQGLFYLAWLMDHRTEFQALVRERLGTVAASQILWIAPRLICIAGDFTRYDLHAVREHRRSIDLVRYQLYGQHHIGLETVASVAPYGRWALRLRRDGAEVSVPVRRTCEAMTDLATAVDEAMLGPGGDVAEVERKQYDAYQRLRNVDLVPRFTRDVRVLGHHGTVDLEVQLRSGKDLERAMELFRPSYGTAA